MDFVNTVNKYNEMCTSSTTCTKCPLKEKAKDYMLCSTYAFKHPKAFTKIIENWSKESHD